MSYIQKFWRPLIAIIFMFALIKLGPFNLNQFKMILSEPKILFLGFILFLIQYLLFALRWKKILDESIKISMSKAFRLTLIGQFFSFFIPGGVGGDVIKALELSKAEKTSKSIAFSSVIADRILGLFAIIFFSVIFLTIDVLQKNSSEIQYFLILSLVLLIIASIGLLFSPFIVVKIESRFQSKNSIWIIKLHEFINSFKLTFELFRNIKFMWSNIFICFTIQLISIYFIFFVIQVLQINPPNFMLFFSLCCFGFLASAIPLTPAGIGLGQAAFYVIFSKINTQVGEASIVAISTMQLFQLFFAIIGGYFFSSMKNINTLPPSTPNQQ